MISNRPSDELPLLPSGAYPDTMLDNLRVTRKRIRNQSVGVDQILFGRKSVEAAAEARHDPRGAKQFP